MPIFIDKAIVSPLSKKYSFLQKTLQRTFVFVEQFVFFMSGNKRRGKNPLKNSRLMREFSVCKKERRRK